GRAEPVVPEPGDLRLLRRPGRAVGTAQVLDLVEGGGVVGGVEGGRGPRAELVAAGHRERRHVPPLRGQGRQEGGRGRPPVPRVGPRRVSPRGAGAVGPPPVEDLPGDLASPLDALAGPAGGMPAKSAARAESKVPAWLGNRAVSVSWAAWAAAASREAPREAWTWAW